MPFVAKMARALSAVVQVMGDMHLHNRSTGSASASATASCVSEHRLDEARCREDFGESMLTINGIETYLQHAERSKLS